ncbi:hypothetical protein [Pedobacter agri]|uniref:Uncharacterized protein n=1 Tax=Pedobacter agri TaxID=454586 RepID=A0A9X3I962_9SPHI|nr:hypothetical protein [Pedobacter agri]MCX3264208.1 hypothetical protein [Pedobacter agri]
MKQYILISLMLLTSASLSAQKKEIVNYNIIFSPDLSNRLNTTLYPKVVNDADIVEGVLKNIYPILRIKRSQDQLDRYSVDFVNKGLISMYKVNTDMLNIDFQRFERQSDRIAYVMARKVPRTLTGDVSGFMSEYRKFSEKASKSNNGADIWSYFQSGIDNRIVLPSLVNAKVTQKFRNIMVLLTDGYIEAGIYNKGYDLSAKKVADFRKSFLKSKSESMESFLSKNKVFRINPVKNAELKNLEVIVLEMYDRSLSKTGAATAHPTDMEIMKVIWTDWMRASGVKRFELRQTASNSAEAVKYVMDFIRN